MPLDQLCNRDVVTVAPQVSVREAVRLMRTQQVDVVVVVDAARRPLGLLTDRDIVAKGLAGDVEGLGALSVDAVMAPEPVVVAWNTRFDTALMRMRRGGLRRLLVVGLHGALVGMVSLEEARSGDIEP